MSKKVVWTQQPASFSINVTHKSSPDLLSYFCQAVSTSGLQWLSTQLQMYWELWASECGTGNLGRDFGHLGGPSRAGVE